MKMILREDDIERYRKFQAKFNGLYEDLEKASECRGAKIMRARLSSLDALEQDSLLALLEDLQPLQPTKWERFSKRLMLVCKIIFAPVYGVLLLVRHIINRANAKKLERMENAIIAQQEKQLEEQAEMLRINDEAIRTLYEQKIAQEDIA